MGAHRCPLGPKRALACCLYADLVVFAPLLVRPQAQEAHRIGLIEYFDRGETGIKTIAAVHSQCRSWVKSRHVQCTSRMSALCQ